MNYWIYVSIAMYFLALVIIGRHYYDKNASLSEYLIDNRRLNPFVTALSAGASDMSGWMLLGLPGAFFATGISTAWIAIGLSIGAWCAYKFLAKRLRIYTEVASDSITIPDFLENRFKDKTKSLRIISGLLIIIFFTLYVSSGIIAGGKSFETFFGLNFAYGAIATICIVVFYTFFGGFKAVAITDAFQGALMFIVLIMIPAFSFNALQIPDSSSFWNEVAKISPSHLDPFEGQTFLGILGLLSWGFGYFGQPHIIVRFMAIRNSAEMSQARRIGISWMVFGLLGAMASGLIGLVYFHQNSLTIGDPEKIFLELGKIFFHPFILGVIISAVLAAIMSTISSQLLVSASSVTKDFIFAFYKKEVSSATQTLVSRLAVVFIAFLATIAAFLWDDSVLNVVGHAWAGFGASFGAVLLFSLYSKHMSALSALCGMIVGGVTVIIWIIADLSGYIYSLLPGFTFSMIAIMLVNKYNSVLDKMADEPNLNEIAIEFEKMKARNESEKK